MLSNILVHCNCRKQSTTFGSNNNNYIDANLMKGWGPKEMQPKVFQYKLHNERCKPNKRMKARGDAAKSIKVRASSFNLHSHINAWTTSTKILIYHTHLDFSSISTLSTNKEWPEINQTLNYKQPPFSNKLKLFIWL